MDRLWRPIDIASLIFFRIAFGVLAFADVLGTWLYKHLYIHAFDPAGFQFKYYGFEWVQPLPEPWMSLIFVLQLLVAVGITIGWRYRWCCLIYAVIFAYSFLMEKAYYLNHGYLFIVLSFLMATLPAHANYSVDVLRGRVKQLSTIPYWPLFLLQFSMAVVYFYGGIAKINADWLQAMPLKLWLNAKSDMPILGVLWRQEWVAYLMSYGGLFLDLFVVVFLLFRRTRVIAIGFVLLFHLTNFILFKIGIFPFLSTALTFLFFDPDFPRRWWAWWSQRLPVIDRVRQWWRKKAQSIPADAQAAVGSNRKLIKTGILLYAAYHLLMPMRQHLYTGPTAWTEEGHRFSWRMMLRSKRGFGDFKLVDLKSGESFTERARDHLGKHQRYKVYTRPDMTLQFAHYLRDLYAAKGLEVAVYANTKVKLNGRSYQDYIDPTVDLAKTEWDPIWPSEWILPMKNPKVKK